LTLGKKNTFNVEYQRILPQIHRDITRRNRTTLTKVMESGSAVLGPHLESHWNYEKIEHENGLKFRPSSKREL